MKKYWRWFAFFSIVCLHTLMPGCRSGSGHSSEQYLSGEIAAWNMRLYTATRDYIQADTAARRIFNHPEPFQVWVSDRATCLTGFYYWNWPGWLEWMGLSVQGREERRRIRDSLYHHVKRTRCQTATNPALGRLSTTADQRYSIQFKHIDSTFLPDRYIVSAHLLIDFPRSDSIDYGDTCMFYSIILDNSSQVIKAFSRKTDFCD